MIHRLGLCLGLFFCLPAHADPFDISENSRFGFGTDELEGLGNPLIEELGPIGALETQSRAVELLGNEFSRAAAQGLIDAQETPSAPIETTVEGTLYDRSNLFVVTGIDRDSLATPNIGPISTGAICFSNHDVDVASWGDANDQKLLGTLRTKAIAENGDITPKGALSLARFYLSLGFGAEAKALVGYIGNPKHRDIVVTLADILDTGTSAEPALNGQIYCKGKVSFWAALAQPISKSEVPINTDVILNTFAELPFHLRAHLGPLLAERLRDAKLDKQAQHVLNAIVRSNAKSEESTLETAKLGLSGAQPDQARDELVELSNGTDVVAAKALLELLNDAQSRELQPQVAWVEDAASLVRATEGAEVSQKLNLAGLRGMVSLNRFDDVRLALNEDGPGLTDETRAEIAEIALIGATRNAPNDVFLRSTIGLSKHFEIGALGHGDRFALARRLVKLGLLERAASYLPAAAETAEERRVTSTILAGIGQTPAAIEVLEKNPNDLLSQLAGLQARVGKVNQALENYTQDGQIPAATLLAIQSGNWDWITDNGDELAANAAKALLNPLPGPTTTPINGKLIQQVQTRRQQAALLLESLENPELVNTFTN